MIGVLDIQFDTPPAETVDTDAYLEFVVALEKFKTSMEFLGEDIKELYRRLRKALGNAGDWRWKREPWAPPDRPEKLRGLRQYGPARVVTEPPGGVLYLKCARRFKKGSRSDHT